MLELNTEKEGFMAYTAPENAHTYSRTVSEIQSAVHQRKPTQK